MESLEDEEAEIRSVSGERREGQPFRAPALPEQDRLRVAYYSDMLDGCS